MKTTELPHGPRRSYEMALPAFVGVALLFFPGLVAGQDGVPTGEAVTFAKDVAPILQANCQTCHRPGAMGPMSLLTYEDVQPFAPLIKDKVELSTDAALVY